jgi:checkpoint serine/threonine-protein kinase
VFVDLEALYPTPAVFGTELCFEELMASHRGWLHKVWKPENSQKQKQSPASQGITEESNDSMENINREVSGKLIIPRDPIMLDENGATKHHGREGRGRKMKIKEVNETQISK